MYTHNNSNYTKLLLFIILVLLFVLNLVHFASSHESGIKHKCIHHKFEEALAQGRQKIITIKQSYGIKSKNNNNINNNNNVFNNNQISDQSQDNQIEQQQQQQQQQQKRNNEQDNSGYPPFAPIRILINYDAFDNDDDYTCKNVSQKVTQLQSDGTVGNANYVCTADDVLTPQKIDYLLNKLLNYSISMLESALTVYRPDVLDLYAAGGCINSRSTSDVHTSDYDFVLFITARPIYESGVIAYAKPCTTDQYSRPTSGYANFHPKYLINNNNDFPRQSGITIHEISHSLGFTQPFSFIYWTGETFGDTYRFNYYSPVEQYVDKWGATHYRITSPSVVSMVRKHFNCSNLTGGELEDGGTAVTAASHWEKRVFMNEYMTGTDNNFPVFSNITLALFNDTGYYRVNFTAAIPFVYGYNWGCSFVQDDCGKWTKNPNLPSEGFCDSSSDFQSDKDVHCTFDRRGYGVCNMNKDYVGLPERYQHYSNPSWGGTDKLADYCAYIGQQGATTYCNTGGTETSFFQSSDTVKFIADSGEQFEMNSRCMFSTLSKVKSGAIEIESFQPLLAPVARSARCYNHTCVSDNDLRIQIDGVWYPCPGTPRAKDGKYAITGVFGFGGEVECPEPTKLCGGSKPDFTWPQLIRIFPTSGAPSTKITIVGANFVVGRKYEIIMEVDCSNITVINSTHITATIPGSDHFVSIADLDIFQTKKNLIIRDDRGYTDQRAQIFTIQVKFDATYLRNLFIWMGDNPLAAFIASIVIIVPCLCCCGCLYFFLRKKKIIGNYKQGEQDFSDEAYDYDFDDNDTDNPNRKASKPNLNTSKKQLKKKTTVKDLTKRISEKVTNFVSRGALTTKVGNNSFGDDEYDYEIGDVDVKYVKSTKVNNDNSGFTGNTTGTNTNNNKKNFNWGKKSADDVPTTTITTTAVTTTYAPITIPSTATTNISGMIDDIVNLPTASKLNIKTNNPTDNNNTNPANTSTSTNVSTDNNTNLTNTNTSTNISTGNNTETSNTYTSLGDNTTVSTEETNVSLEDNKTDQ